MLLRRRRPLAPPARACHPPFAHGCVRLSLLLRKSGRGCIRVDALMARASTCGCGAGAPLPPPPMLVIPLAPRLHSVVAVAEDAVRCLLIYFINCLLTTPPPRPPLPGKPFYTFFNTTLMAFFIFFNTALMAFFIFFKTALMACALMGGDGCVAVQAVHAAPHPPPSHV